MALSPRRLAAVLLGLIACTREQVPPLAPGNQGSGLKVSIRISTLTGPVGGQVAVQIAATGEFATPLAGVEGRLYFDPATLQYLGQPLTGRAIVLVNEARVDQGELRVISFDREGVLQPTAELVFAVRQPDYAGGLHYRFEKGATQGLVELDRAVSGAGVALSDQPPSSIPPRHLTAADWIAYLHLDAAAHRFHRMTPGAGTLYGDATLDATINVLDAVSTANLSIGLLPLLTDPSKDYVIAANVAPGNLPGLGEPGDPVPPGRNPDGSFTIDVLDVVAIANGAVTPGDPVVGQPIPGRSIPGNRVIVSGSLAADRTFFRDTVYELQGTVAVPAGLKLTIESGARIEGDSVTRGALVIRRGGKIDARGTRLLPVVFTCNRPLKTRGCWGGVVIDGFSLLNNPSTIGCPQKPTIGDSDQYGGCLVQDSSGVLRYVRIEYGGMAPAGEPAAPGLALLGVGTATVIDSSQVYGALGDGVFVSGGTAQIRALILTNNMGAGLSWVDGWVGKGQFLIVQQDGDNRVAIDGSNSPLGPDALPRSAPQLYNVTLVGPGAGVGPAGILLRNGSAGTIRNAVVLQPGMAGLDIQGVESCVLATATTPTILVENSVFFGGNPDFASDNDCVDESAYALAISRSNRVADPQLTAPAFTLSADLRPLPSSPLLSGFVVPPSDGFFDTTPSYLGAVPPANGTGTNVPWYAGWSRGWGGTP